MHTRHPAIPVAHKRSTQVVTREEVVDAIEPRNLVHDRTVSVQAIQPVVGIRVATSAAWYFIIIVAIVSVVVVFAIVVGFVVWRQKR